MMILSYKLSFLISYVFDELEKNVSFKWFFLQCEFTLIRLCVGHLVVKTGKSELQNCFKLVYRSKYFKQTNCIFRVKRIKLLIHISPFCPSPQEIFQEKV